MKKSLKNDKKVNTSLVLDKNKKKCDSFKDNSCLELNCRDDLFSKIISLTQQEENNTNSDIINNNKNEVEKFSNNIEESIRKKFHKSIFTKFCQAINKYDLISPNDKIAVLASNTKCQIIECFNKFEVAEAANLIVSFAELFVNFSYSLSTMNMRLFDFRIVASAVAVVVLGRQKFIFVSFVVLLISYAFAWISREEFLPIDTDFQ